MREDQFSGPFVEQHYGARFGVSEFGGRLDDNTQQWLKAERGVENLAHLYDAFQIANAPLKTGDSLLQQFITRVHVANFLSWLNLRSYPCKGCV